MKTINLLREVADIQNASFDEYWNINPDPENQSIQLKGLTESFHICQIDMWINYTNTALITLDKN